MKREYIILLIILAMGLLDLHQTSSAYAKEMSFEEDIEKYKTEAKSLISSANDPKLADTTKSLKGFTDNPEEGSLNEEDLRIKGDEKIKGKNIKENEEEGEREAINAVKHSNANNPHRSKYTVTKLKNKAFMKKSAAIVENPISGLNVAANAGCKIIGGDKGGENVSFEEYYVDVEDMRVKEVKQTCEEDEDRLFYCNRSIKDVKCQAKGDCGYNVGGVLLDSVKSGIVYRYSYPTLTFGNAYGISSGYMSDSQMAQSTVFRCGTNCCGIETIRANFEIKDKANIGVFKLSRITSVQPLMIKLNEEVIYHSFGGYKFEKTGRYASGSQLRSYYAKNNGNPPSEWTRLINTGNGEYSCYPNNLGFITLRAGDSGRTAAGGEYFRPIDDRDLKQKLREGSNQLEITLAFDDVGFIETEFYLQQYCCKEWNDEWESDCPVNE